MCIRGRRTWDGIENSLINESNQINVKFNEMRWKNWIMSRKFTSMLAEAISLNACC